MLLMQQLRRQEGTIFWQRLFRTRLRLQDSQGERENRGQRISRGEERVIGAAGSGEARLGANVNEVLEC